MARGNYRMGADCRHDPKLTGRRIRAEYGKPNLPERREPVQSVGEEAMCKKCGAYLIVHETQFRFAQALTELEH